MTHWGVTLGEFGQHLAAGGRSKGTRELRTYHLSAFAESTTRGPDEVTRDALESWLANPDWSANTRRSARSSLVAFFRWLQVTGRRSDDPAATLPTVKAVIGKPRPCPEKHLRSAVIAAGPRERLMLTLGAGYGLRRSEIAAVRGDHVEDALGGPVLRVEGKGGRVRMIPITDETADRLRERQGYAFPNEQRGGHLTPAHVGKCISRLLPEGWTTHTLRHRFASAAYLADRDIRAVQELLGHSSVATTQIYTAIPAEATRRGVAAAADGLRVA